MGRPAAQRRPVVETATAEHVEKDSSGIVPTEIPTLTIRVTATLEMNLSFAQNGSEGIALRRRAFVTVMQAAEVRNLDDLSDTRDLPSMRTLLVES